MKKVQLKIKEQSTLIIRENSNEDDFNTKLSNTSIEAGSPIIALENPGLKSFPQKGFQRSITCATTLLKTSATESFKEKFDLLGTEVNSWNNFFIKFDEADYSGEKYYCFLIGKLDENSRCQPFLQIMKEKSDLPMQPLCKPK